MEMQSNRPANRILISYRRDDARGASSRIDGWLRIAFGREQVFRDDASIGQDRWRDKIGSRWRGRQGLPKQRATPGTASISWP